MKLFVKLLVIVLVIGMLLPFTLLKGKDGKTLMSFSDIKFPGDFFSDLFTTNIPGMNKLKEMTTQSDSASGNSLIYKWTDIDGNLQFSSSPPEEGTEYTVKGYDSNQNVIQSISAEPDEKNLVVSSPPDEGNSGRKDKVGNPYSVEKVEKLFKDAEGLESLLNDRLKKQDAIIGQ